MGVELDKLRIDMINYLLLIAFIGSIVAFAYIWIEGKKDYNEFVSFLRKENDLDTLEKIGARFEGEDLKYPIAVLKFSMENRLSYMYETTKKQEYLSFLEKSQIRSKTTVATYFIAFALGICVYLRFFK